MEERNYLIILYDYYGELLTDKQRMYFEDYYFNNLSLGEISENDGLVEMLFIKILRLLKKNYTSMKKNYLKISLKISIMKK